MPARYRAAIIGRTGRGDYGHGLDQVWHHLPQCEVVALADADDEGRGQAAQRLGVARAYADYREMLDREKPDVVSIAPRWVDEHRDMVTAAAQRGIHIYLEKPLCRDLEEADAMVAVCEQNQVKLALAHQTRYSPRLSMIRQLLEQGVLGEVLEFRGRGKEDHRGGGEDLWVLGSHVMNLIDHLGGSATWCQAVVKQAGDLATADDVVDGNEGIGPLVGDEVHAMYGLASGATAYFDSKRDASGGRFGLRIFGSRGVLDLTTGYLPEAWLLEDPAWLPPRHGHAWKPITSAGVGEPEPYHDGSAHAGNVAACQDLLQAIEEDRQPECSVYEGRATIEMILGVFASHRHQQRQSLPLVDRSHPLRSWATSS